MEYLRINQALKIVLDSVATQSSETVAIEKSLGRVLAEDILANRDLPPFDVSAMDGFAVRSADLPGQLAIIEDIKAGDIPKMTLEAGLCARIMTGAALPQGADAVIRVEDTRQISANKVQIDITVKAGNDVRLRGENMQTGDVVLTSGTEITPGAIGILATVKAKEVQVHRKPSVAILSTGNELESIDDPVDPNRIPDSNSHALMAQVQAQGIEPVLLGIARDDPDELEAFLERGLAYDVLLVSGGSSVGVHDHVRPTLGKLDVEMKFWRVAMKPGHPLAFGVLKREDGSRTRVFGLPGNPVSSMVCFEQFVAPLLRRMMGNSRLHRRTVQARLAHPVRMKPGRTEFVRVQLASDESGYLASTTGTQSSGVLLSMARADGLMVLPADCTGLAAGEKVTVQLLDGTEFQDEAGFQE
jgi:molybdopterin molybdotransferase